MPFETVAPSTAHSVLIVEDEEPLAKAAARSLQPTYHVLPLCLSLDEAEVSLATHHIGSVILDVIFPNGESSLDRLPDWVRRYPDTNFIIRTAHPDQALPLYAIQLGAIGYLLKPGVGLQEIAGAIESGRAGLIHLNQGAREYLREMPPKRRFDIPLWDQQVDCIQIAFNVSEKLAAVALLKHRLLTEKEIRLELNITFSAVHSRLLKLYITLGIASETALVLRVERALAKAGVMGMKGER